jgi:SAM-dependent methyltransferase/uncharacterized protein YbaR (Trm112 family)
MGEQLNTELQDIANKRSEIEFRRKLASQTAGETIYFPDEPNSSEIMHIMDERMLRTLVMCEEMLKNDVNISPYLELGAERCQRALVLENECHASGIAVDISLESLLFASRIAEAKGFKSMPVRVCCDAHCLPIKSHSIPFTFCYQTLHHFPNPRPVSDELVRVLTNDGTFYFDEEPVRMRGKLFHFRRGNKILSSLEKVLAKLHLLDFFSSTGRAEVEAGVVEADFTLRQWGSILAQFSIDDVIVDSRLIHNRKLNKLVRSYGPSRWWVEAMGGNIHGICRRKEPVPDNKDKVNHNPIDLLICPECKQKGNETKLGLSESGMTCPYCKTIYPQVEGVHLLFCRELGHELYPEHFN